MKTLILTLSLLVSGFAYASGDQFSCTETDGPVGAVRTLTLTQIGDSNDWELKVYSTVVYPDAQPELVLESTLSVDEENTEDVLITFVNANDDITYKIYMDELYMTYLYLPGTDKSAYFNCEN